MNCYVLIGGHSSRMGRSKAALFLDRVAGVARPVFENVLAVQRPGAEAATLETIFEEKHEDEAPLFGVAAALRHAAAPCFVLATDYPYLTSDFLRDVRDSFEGSDAEIVAPLWNRIPQTLCAGYRPAVLPAVQERLRTGRLDVRGLLVTCRTQFLSEELIRARFGNRVLMNVNTPDELAEAERLE